MLVCQSFEDVFPRGVHAGDKCCAVSIFFEGVDAVGTITREIAVTPVDESVVIPSGKEKNNDYFVITNTWEEETNRYTGA